MRPSHGPPREHLVSCLSRTEGDARGCVQDYFPSMFHVITSQSCMRDYVSNQIEVEGSRAEIRKQEGERNRQSSDCGSFFSEGRRRTIVQFDTMIIDTLASLNSASGRMETHCSLFPFAT